MGEGVVGIGVKGGGSGEVSEGFTVELDTGEGFISPPQPVRFQANRQIKKISA